MRLGKSHSYSRTAGVRVSSPRHAGAQSRFRGGHRQNSDRARRPDANRGGLRRSCSGDHRTGSARGLGFRLRPAEHPQVRSLGPACRRPYRIRRRAWCQTARRNTEQPGQPGGVPHRSEPPHTLGLHPETLLVAEPDRDLVRNPEPQSSAPRQLRLHRGTAGAHPRGRGRLQPHHGHSTGPTGDGP